MNSEWEELFILVNSQWSIVNGHVSMVMCHEGIVNRHKARVKGLGFKK